MRYCSYCGNPLNPGASFCHSCGAALKAIVPETDDVTVIAPAEEDEVTMIAPEEVIAPAPQAPVVMEAAPTAEPVVLQANSDKDVQDEKKFLDDTHKFLRWERKAWNIAGKVQLILGIVYAALFLLLGIILAAVESPAAGAVMLVYAVVFGMMFIGLGIVGLKAADKIPQYTDTLYKDFRAAYKRCTSIGMIVFCYFFNTISLVFFVINFVRLKSNRAMCERILSRQGVK